MLPTIIHRTGLGRPVSLLNELDRLFGSNCDESSDCCTTTGAYPVDIHEDDEAVYVEAELPGFQKNEVDVSVEKGVLRITAERKTEEIKGKPQLSERRYTHVARAFTLSPDVDEDKVEAKLDHGVLSLKFSKRHEVKPRRITVA